MNDFIVFALSSFLALYCVSLSLSLFVVVIFLHSCSILCLSFRILWSWIAAILSDPFAVVISYLLLCMAWHQYIHLILWSWTAASIWLLIRCMIRLIVTCFTRDEVHTVKYCVLLLSYGESSTHDWIYPPRSHQHIT